MNSVTTTGVIIILADVGFLTLTVVAVISKFGYERLPPDRRNALVTSSYRTYGLRLPLFSKLTLTFLVLGVLLVAIGAL